MEYLSQAWTWLIETLSLGGFIFVAIIFFLFIFAVVRFLFPVWRTGTSLKTASLQVKSEAFEARDEDQFWGRGKSLNSHWTKFMKHRKETMIPGDASAAAPEAYFSVEAVLPEYNRSAALAFAGVFAGLGILGTFVGLILGLLGINTAEGEVLTSVTQFIGGMSTAFWSSTAGISTSLIWLVLDRGSVNRLRFRLDEFNLAVRAKLRTHDAEDLLALLSRQQNESLTATRDQKAILQNLGTDIASALGETIGEAIDRSFSQQLTPALTDISGTLQRVSALVGDQQVDALSEMAESFRSNLTAAVTEEFDRMASSIRDATEWQQRVNSDVSQLFERLDTIGTTQSDMIERSTIAANRFMESLGEIGAIHEKLVEASGSIESATGDVNALAMELRGQVEVFSSSNEQIREQLATQLDTMANQVQVLSSFWENFSGQLQGLSDNLERSVTEFSGLAADKLGEVFSRFDSEMATIVQHLSGTLAEIREVTDEFPPSVEQLKESVEKASVPMETAGSQFEQLTKLLTEFRDLGPSVGAAVEELSRNRQAIQALSAAITARRARPKAESVARSGPDGELPEGGPHSDEPINGEPARDIGAGLGTSGIETATPGIPEQRFPPPMAPGSTVLGPDSLSGRDEPPVHRTDGPEVKPEPPAETNMQQDDGSTDSSSRDSDQDKRDRKPWWRTWGEGR